MLRRELALFFSALGFFTRLPVPAWVGYDAARLTQVARYFPAVGLLIGGIGAAVFWLASWLWPQPIVVLLAMAATILATGAFHEDGLADAADGLGGGWDKQRILEIMKDSRVGSYGVIAITLALLGKFVLLANLPAGLVPPALIAGHAFSRLCATAVMGVLDYARDDASSKARPMASRLGVGALTVAALFGCAPLAVLPWPQAAAGVLLAAVATLWLAAKCRRWLGGYTGDCLGAVQQLAELAFYLALCGHWAAANSV